MKRCCELLSNCIFDVLNTVIILGSISLQPLWIAFKLYLWRIEHSQIMFSYLYKSVVNCFQIVSLTYWTQLDNYKGYVKYCCELLSNCIFDVLNTVKELHGKYKEQLWIAFKLYLWRIEHSGWRCNARKRLVVNCFQIVSLTYWTQYTQEMILTFSSCELLSNCIFDVLNTVLFQILLRLVCCELLSNCIFDVLNTVS